MDCFPYRGPIGEEGRVFVYWELLELAEGELWVWSISLSLWELC
jgi:hypothetical protein